MRSPRPIHVWVDRLVVWRERQVWKLSANQLNLECGARLSPSTTNRPDPRLRSAPSSPQRGIGSEVKLQDSDCNILPTATPGPRVGRTSCRAKAMLAGLAGLHASFRPINKGPARAVSVGRLCDAVGVEEARTVTTIPGHAPPAGQVMPAFQSRMAAAGVTPGQ